VKILAVISVAPHAQAERIGAGLRAELEASWALLQADILREAYATDFPSRVVFVLEASSVLEAAAVLNRLPLVAEDQFRIELTPLLPFVNWARLFAG
jgi:hypothetical protein